MEVVHGAMILMSRMTPERPRVNCLGPRALREKQCRPTNTSARPATSASRQSSDSPIRLSRCASTAAVNSGRSSRRWASCSREVASIRRTVGEPTNLRLRPQRRRPRRHHRPNQVQRRLRRPRRRQRRPRRQLRRRTKSPRPRYCRLRRSVRPPRPGAIRGRFRPGRRRAASAATWRPR